MTDLRVVALILSFLVVLIGTLHSVKNNTYLDTSNPLLTALPHPLHKTHYFASKSNPLNTVFIKRAWGWTSAVFILHIFTSPPRTHRARRTIQYLLATFTWLAFTTWFFGPALIDRFIVVSGGECVLHLPGPDGAYVPVDQEYCFTHARLSPSTHPDLFPPTPNASALLEKWAGVPRLRRGHDVSGHVFLLTLSTLFLADQVRASFRARTAWSQAHLLGVVFSVSLIMLWLFANWTTSVYYHSPVEKASGFRACFSCIYLLIEGSDHNLSSRRSRLRCLAGTTIAVSRGGQFTSSNCSQATSELRTLRCIDLVL